MPGNLEKHYPLQIRVTSTHNLIVLAFKHRPTHQTEFNGVCTAPLLKFKCGCPPRRALQPGLCDDAIERGTRCRTTRTRKNFPSNAMNATKKKPRVRLRRKFAFAMSIVCVVCSGATERAAYLGFVSQLELAICVPTRNVTQSD